MTIRPKTCSHPITCGGNKREAKLRARIAELERALDAARERNGAYGRAISVLCLSPGIDDSPEERAKYTIACLREAIADRDKARDRIAELERENETLRRERNQARDWAEEYYDGKCPWPKPTYPYPWCRDRDGCRGRGSCPHTPTCGD